MIYGAALLAACMLTGSFLGNTIGLLIGLNSDVGGVGFAMLLLLWVTNSEKIFSKLPKGTHEGLSFWKDMFLPIVVAMSASQNVYNAVSSGMLAIIGGLAAVAVAFALVPVLGAMVGKKADKEEEKAC